jgi:hypothetical protein
MTQERLGLAIDKRVAFGPETREAELFTQFTIGGRELSLTAAGARGCSVEASQFDAARGTQRFDLTCSLTWFEAEDAVLGPVRIFQDPRIVNRGTILARRTAEGAFETPALSYFNQHLIFHVGELYLYYPRAWQVVSSITQWPPEFHQYHHLEDKTPVFNSVTRAPNVAVKGISTISIKGQLTPDRLDQIRESLAVELDRFDQLPASKMSPEDLTPAA